MNTNTRLPTLLASHDDELRGAWLAELSAALGDRSDLIGAEELREEVSGFVAHLRDGLQSEALTEIGGPAWRPLRELLAQVSKSRARLGFTSSETATFVFSFKQPLFSLLRRSYETDAAGLAADTWTATLLLDKLGLYTVEEYLERREEVIGRQHHEMIELSSPVVELWDGILGLPIIGTLDSRRTQSIMEALLGRIASSGSDVAIIDITGVPTVDTLTAQHLLKTVAAIRLMGAECIISGIRPEIAQTMVHLGINLAGVTTRVTMAGALVNAFKLRRLRVVDA